MLCNSVQNLVRSSGWLMYSSNYYSLVCPWMTDKDKRSQGLMYEALNLLRKDHFLWVYSLLYKKCFSFAGAKFTAGPKMV